MSFAIYQDTENVNPRFARGKKNKNDALCNNENSKIPRPNKRVALGTISQNNCRIQPSRLAKGKQNSKSLLDVKPGFAIFNDEPEVQKVQPVLLEKENSCPKDSLMNTVPPAKENVHRKDSLMIVSPPLCETSSIDEIQSDLNLSIIDNIDLKADPLLGMPEYASDIHMYLKKAELNFRPKLNYMKSQRDINSSMRAILIDWLVEVAEEYKLKSQTLFLTVNYIDRFLSYMSVFRDKLQLVGAACMLVSTKFEEIYPPEVKEFIYITDDSYTSQQVLRMEHLILKTLSFDLSVPTCIDFITRYLVAAEGQPGSQLHFLSEYICELALINMEVSVKYLPSMVAAAAICLARITLKLSTWSKSLEFYTDYQIPDIHPCVKDLHSIYKNAAAHPQQSVRSKYKDVKFGCVSEVMPPQNVNILERCD